MLEFGECSTIIQIISKLPHFEQCQLSITQKEDMVSDKEP